MTTPELIAYIKNSLAQGKTMDAIRTPLFGAGWDENDLKEALAIINPINPTPKVPPVAVATPSLPPIPLIPKNQPMSSSPASPSGSTTPSSLPATPNFSSAKPLSSAAKPETSSFRQFFAGTPAQSAGKPPESFDPRSSQTPRFSHTVGGLENMPMENYSARPAQPQPAQTAQRTAVPVQGFDPMRSRTTPPFVSNPSAVGGAPAQPMVEQKPRSNFLMIFINFFLLGTILFAVWYFYHPQIEKLLGISAPAPAVVPATTNTAPAQQTPAVVPTATATDQTAPNPQVLAQTAESNYSDSHVKFSYNKTGTILPSKSANIINIGTGAADPLLETAAYYADTTKVDPVLGQGGNYTKLPPETYGQNIFEAYRSAESGTKIYVLRSGTRAISIAVPYRTGGNDTTTYIDLGTVSF